MRRKKGSKADKIVLTGGHAATTAVAVIEEIKKDSEALLWELYWLGEKYAFEGKKALSLEYQVLPKLGVNFVSLVSGRLQKRFTFWTIPSIIKIPIGFIHASFILLRIRPKVVLSFGGFSSFPVVFISWLMRVPVIIHEQTSAVGRANRLASVFAIKIAISRESSKKYFSVKKTKLIGNPILNSIKKVKPKSKLPSSPNLFITTGSRGSVPVNKLVKEILKELLLEFNVYHQTGPINFEDFSTLKSTLPLELRNKYNPRSTIDPFEMHEYYRESDIIVARAGANTVSEIIAIKRPAILIPLPFAHLNEQTLNAKVAQRTKIVTLLNQETLTSKNLLKEIRNIRNSWEKLISSHEKIDIEDNKAASRLVSLLKEEI